jgi:putative hydrolase of the HAD superfamily
MPSPPLTYLDLLAIPTDALPPTIFLDAVGTIFGVKGGVGAIYSEFAQKFGVDCEPVAVDRAFYQEFKAADPSIFAGVVDVPAQEYLWWQEINRRTFTRLGRIQDFTDFDTFFSELYEHFATAAAWEVYPDTVPALDRWQQQGITLAMLSNFDSRLYRVLAALDLRKYFSSVTISTEVGAAKPAAQIFQQALATQQVAAQNTWHIGDSELEDYQGATAVGIKAWLLQRS